MAFELTDLVWDSRVGLQPMEKLVLLRIADRADRQSGEMFAGIRSIAADCELSKTGTINIVERLIRGGFLTIAREAIGTRPRTLRLETSKLVSGQPTCPQASGQPGCPQGQTAPFGAELQPPASGQPGEPSGQASGQPGERQRSTPLTETVLTVEPREPYVQTGADAPALALSQPEAPNQEPERPTFKVYAAIATEALGGARTDDSGELAEVRERFKQACARQRLPYDADITRKAVDAAISTRDKAKSVFEAQLRTFGGLRSVAQSGRR